MAGGRNGSTGSILDTLEMINLETRSSCIVDVKLDKPRMWHTGDGNLICGGLGDGDGWKDDGSNCFNIATRNSINLIDSRWGHTSWSSNDGIYLIGGYMKISPAQHQYKTNTLVTGDTTQNGFTLKYSTR